jgi:hypothetical protein
MIILPEGWADWPLWLPALYKLLSCSRSVRMPKIACIGAGSVVFTRNLCSDRTPPFP